MNATLQEILLTKRNELWTQIVEAQSFEHDYKISFTVEEIELLLNSDPVNSNIKNAWFTEIESMRCIISDDCGAKDVNYQFRIESQGSAEDYLSILDNLGDQYLVGKPYPDDHVFDENQTVKWNREQVELKNEILRTSKNLYRRIEALLINKWSSAHKCRMAICLFGAEGEKYQTALDPIWNRAWEDGHSGGFREVLQYFREYCDMLDDSLKKLKECGYKIS